MPAEPSVLLVRHGETEWSAAGRHTGRTDVPLTARGRRQAEHIGGLLAEWEVARALTSPLGRALDTARIAGFADAEVLPDLAEWDYGAIEGRTTGEVRAGRPGWTIWKGPVPGGETLTSVAARTDRVVARLAASEGLSAVFAHGHLLRVLAARWLGLPPDAGRLLALDTATLSVLGVERGTRLILRWNMPGQPNLES